ncbi:MAG: hypothetical protein FWE29_04245 [Defluviitaleaceae bacterium]|nr:hypothetical protein [Defluviitaleaceae bacterium]
MKDNSLIERYVHAVSKKLPVKLRKDVSDELNSIISDMLEERCGELVPTDKDILMVLTTLGAPYELANKYRGNEQDCLIGEPHFSNYIWWLKWALGITLIAQVINHITLFFSEPAQNYLLFFLAFIPEALRNLIFAFGVVTLIFAFLHFKGTRFEDELEDLLNLPDITDKSGSISKWDCVWGIGFNIAFLVLFLGIPQVMNIYADGIRTPIFNVDVLMSYWYIIVLFTGLGLAEEIVGLIERKYSIKMMVTNIVANIISAGLAIFLFAGRQIINPDAIDKLIDILGDTGNTAVNLLTNAQYYILALILLGIAIDAFITVFRTLRAKNNE